MVSLSAGSTYYIVIDGYGGDCGEYNLAITESTLPGCTDCLQCATPEGEPDIPDYGYDEVNGGCNQLNNPAPNNNPIYSPISLNQVICGRVNTYIGPDGGDYRDTDWYEITLTEAGRLYWSAYADQSINIYILGGDCSSVIAVADASSSNCNLATCYADLGPGTHWLWVGPTNFSGLDEGENYNVIATLDSPPPADWCELAPAVPVSNWALFIAIGLIVTFVLFRTWRRS
jgi:hypothetical protein